MDYIIYIRYSYVKQRDNAETANIGDKMFSTVKKAIDKHDPYGLLATHAPPDEYDSESLEITSLINGNSSIDEIATIISDVFKRSFDEDFPKEIFIESAQEIKAAIIKSC